MAVTLKRDHTYLKLVRELNEGPRAKRNRIADLAKKIDDKIGLVADDILRLPDYSLSFAKQFTDNPHLPTIHQSVLVSRSVLSALRCIPMAAYFISGKFFKASWTDKILKIILAIGRFLSPLAWLHRLKVINLGEHARWVGFTIMAAFTSLGISSMITSLRNWTKLNTIYHHPERYLEMVKKTRILSIMKQYSCSEEVAIAILEGFERHGSLTKEQVIKIFILKQSNCAVFLKDGPQTIPTQDWARDMLLKQINKLSRNAAGDVLSEAFEVGSSPWENGIVLANNFTFVIVGSVLNFISASIKLLRL